MGLGIKKFFQDNAKHSAEVDREEEFLGEVEKASSSGSAEQLQAKQPRFADDFAKLTPERQSDALNLLLGLGLGTTFLTCQPLSPQTKFYPDMLEGGAKEFANRQTTHVVDHGPLSFLSGLARKETVQALNPSDLASDPRMLWIASESLQSQ